MIKTKTPVIGRKEHARIIEKGRELDMLLFDPLTLESIAEIESQLLELSQATGEEYVAVPLGQPCGGPKRPIALPREDVDAVHRAYEGALRGISPEIGRAYDLQAERELLEGGKSEFNPDHYPPEFIGYLSEHFSDSSPST